MSGLFSFTKPIEGTVIKYCKSSKTWGGGGGGLSNLKTQYKTQNNCSETLTGMDYFIRMFAITSFNLHVHAKHANVKFSVELVYHALFSLHDK